MKIPSIKSVKTAEEGRDLAIQWQHWAGDQDNPMDWGTVADWNAFFDEVALKFPELREEFAENAIISFPAES